MRIRFNARQFFARNKGERLVHDPTGNAALAYAGGFHLPAWEKRPMPDAAGATAYAYEGLALPVTALMGGGYEHGQIGLTTPPMVAVNTTLPTSYGPGTGSIYTQPLYQPLPAGKN